MKHQPERTCIGCREVLRKEEVVRVVAGMDGILIDYREKLPGRAAYVCPRRECIARALSRETLSKALHLKVRPPEAGVFVSRLVEVIREKIRALVAIALKAGKIAVGYSAVSDAVKKGRVKLLLCANDLADSTRVKIMNHGSEAIPCETLFTRDEWGNIFNRELVGVVGVMDDGLARALFKETQRLKGLINGSK